MSSLIPTMHRRRQAVFQMVRDTLVPQQTQYFGTKQERALAGADDARPVPYDLAERLDHALAHALDARHWCSLLAFKEGEGHVVPLVLGAGATDKTWSASWLALVKACEAHTLPTDGGAHPYSYAFGRHTMRLGSNGDVLFSIHMEVGRPADASSLSDDEEPSALVEGSSDEIVLLDEVSAPPPRRRPERWVSTKGTAGESASASSSSDYDRDDSFVASSGDSDSHSSSQSDVESVIV